MNLPRSIFFTKLVQPCLLIRRYWRVADFGSETGSKVHRMSHHIFLIRCLAIGSAMLSYTWRLWQQLATAQSHQSSGRPLRTIPFGLSQLRWPFFLREDVPLLLSRIGYNRGRLCLSNRVSPIFYPAGSVFLTNTALSSIKISEKRSINFCMVSSASVLGTRFLLTGSCLIDGVTFAK